MNTIYIVPIEPIDARYTKQWYTNIPALIEDALKAKNKSANVVTIDGEIPQADQTTKGAFLDFGLTNYYKANQVQRISELFSVGAVKPGDKFLVTDAWNFAITAIRYMSDLLDIPVEISGLWHAGAYDPTDILGYKMQKPWPHHQERAWFHMCDYNYFATEFHKNMFLKNLGIEEEFHHKALRSGQPHDPIIKQCHQYFYNDRPNNVIWPHRYNADKQPEIAEDLIPQLQGNTIITQKLKLSKEDYYKTLGQSAVIFSCSLHENLGISMMEGTLAGAIPIVPDRASYAEMYDPVFKYPSEWTSSWENYQIHKPELVAFINYFIRNRNEYTPHLESQVEVLTERYLNAGVMISKLID